MEQEAILNRLDIPVNVLHVVNHVVNQVLDAEGSDGNTLVEL